MGRERFESPFRLGGRAAPRDRALRVVPSEIAFGNDARMPGSGRNRIFLGELNMTDRKETVVLLGSLDTRGGEFAYVKRLIERRGHQTLTLDTSFRGEPAYVPDLSAADILASAGEDLESLRWSEDRGKVVNAMAVGVVRVIEELHQGGAARRDPLLGRTNRDIHCGGGSAQPPGGRAQGPGLDAPGR